MEWNKVVDFNNAIFPASNQELMEIVTRNIEDNKTADEPLKSEEVFGMMHTYLA